MSGLSFGLEPTVTKCLCPHCGGSGLIHVLDPKALVLAIYDWVAGHEFTARELFDYASEVGGPLAEELGGLSAKRLGKLLRKITGSEFDGLRIERIGADGGGAIWLVVRVRDSNSGAV
jgi:hypothetical protein